MNRHAEGYLANCRSLIDRIPSLYVSADICEILGQWGNGGMLCYIATAVGRQIFTSIFLIRSPMCMARVTPVENENRLNR